MTDLLCPGDSAVSVNYLVPAGSHSLQGSFHPMQGGKATFSSSWCSWHF